MSGLKRPVMVDTPPQPAWRQTVRLGLDAVLVILPAIKEHGMADDTLPAELKTEEKEA